MNVFHIAIPNKSLTNVDLSAYAKQLQIPCFRGVYMRDELPKTEARRRECAIVNFNTSRESGSHWVCYYKDGREQRIYFDSFGQITPIEIQKHLKTKSEFANDTAVIQRNTDIVQAVNTRVCGHLCLFVLKSLSNGVSFQDIITKLVSRLEDSDVAATTTTTAATTATKKYGFGHS